MSLARIYSGFTGLGQLIITKIGDVGGPPASRVSEELDAIIAWAKLSPRCINRDTSTVGNVGAGLDSLHSFSLPANSLQTNGDYLSIHYSGFFASNANTKRIRLSFDAQEAYNSGLFDIRSGSWVFTVKYVRLGATSVRAHTNLVWNAFTRDGAGAMAGNVLLSNLGQGLTVANLNSNAVTILVQGEATANDDVVQNLSIIELTQQ